MSLSSRLASKVIQIFTRFENSLPQVTYEAYSGDSGTKRTYDAPVTLTAIVEHKQKMVRTRDLRDQLSNTRITIPGPTQVSVLDRFTLPNGNQPQILSIEATLKPDGTPYFTTVFF